MIEALLDIVCWGRRMEDYSKYYVSPLYKYMLVEIAAFNFRL